MSLSWEGAGITVAVDPLDPDGQTAFPPARVCETVVSCRVMPCRTAILLSEETVQLIRDRAERSVREAQAAAAFDAARERSAAWALSLLPPYETALAMIEARPTRRRGKT